MRTKNFYRSNNISPAPSVVHSENSARVMSSAGEPADDAPLPAFSAGKIDAANGILSLSWGLEAVRVPGKAVGPAAMRRARPLQDFVSRDGDIESTTRDVTHSRARSVARNAPGITTRARTDGRADFLFAS